MRLSISILYFSGTGNTEILTDLLANALKDDYNVDTFRVEDILKKKIEYNPDKYDIIGIGYPIHGFKPPRVIFKLVDLLESQQSKKVFIYSTCAGPTYLNDIASYTLKKLLTHKGYSLFYERQFYMPSNIAFKYPEEIALQLYNAAVRKTKKMAEDIKLNKVQIRNDKLLPMLLSWMHAIEDLSFQTVPIDFKVLDTCNLCGKCVNSCPQGNICIKDDKIKFNLDCLACYRCVYSCPNRAITGRLFNFAILKDGYSLKKILDDTSIDGNYIFQEPKGYYKTLKKYLSED